MNGRIGKTQVEIGLDEEGLYFEAGSREAAYGFIALLRAGSEEAIAGGLIAYVMTHIVSYEEVEVEMAEVTETESGRGICANREELIHMITNLIQSSETMWNPELIENRDAAAMLAIHIVNGLEDEADKLAEREIGISSDDNSGLVCPECGCSSDGIITFTEHEAVVAKCIDCGYAAELSDFRTATAGDGGEE